MIKVSFYRLVSGLAASLLGMLAVTILVATPDALATGDANSPVCSAATEASPGFRTYLPDCRAYELVTPPRKNGQFPDTGGSAVSTEAKLGFTSLGSFAEPGNSATAEGGEYVAARTGSGWSTVAVNPSAQQFQGGSALIGGIGRESLDFNQDLSQTLLLQPLVGAKPIDLHFYRRSVADGTVSEIGPLVPPATVAAWTASAAETRDAPIPEYVGASADLSNIFFSDTFEEPTSLKWLWPGDKTLGEVHHSLYEYVGSGNSEPELVAVRNSEALTTAALRRHKTHINEAAEQISECGVLLGGLARFSQPISEDTYNAISRSGEAVYFTPLRGPCEDRQQETGTGPTVAEVYARFDRDQTVDISEPSTGPSGDCETCDESEPHDAAFQGASEDGSIAFFISEQKLFGGANHEVGVNLYEFDQTGPAHHKLTFVAPQLSESGGAIGGVMRVTEDGKLIYFVSNAATLSSTLQSASGEQPQAEQPNLYVYDTGSGDTTFVGTLASQDEAEWSSEDIRRVEATQDGRYLLFPSVAHLTPDARGVGRQLYRYEAPSAAKPAGDLVRISIGASGSYLCPQTHAVEQGFNCDGNSGAPPPSVFSATYTRLSEPRFSVQRAQPTGTAMSSDASKIFFESPDALTPGALDQACAREASGTCAVAVDNVYEWSDGKVYLLSDGQDSARLFGASATKLIGANPTGADVFITTASALVPQDIDSQVDVYDVRTEGGFPPEPIPVQCSSTCGAVETPAPVFGAPGSAIFTGPSNVPVSVKPASKVAPKRKPKGKIKKCKKSFIEKRGRCVRTTKTRAKKYSRGSK